MVWPTKYDLKLKLYDSMVLPGQQLDATYSNTEVDQMSLLDISASSGCQRLTGIIVTMGPSTYDIEVIQNMIEAGMNIALINLEYGSNQEVIDAVYNLRQAVKFYSSEKGKVYPLAIAAGLSGYKLSTGKIAGYLGETVELKTGGKVKITTDEFYRNMCTGFTVFIDYKHQLGRIVKEKITILSEEEIILKVENVTADSMTCLVEKGGILKSFTEVHTPGPVLGESELSNKDKTDIKMLLELKVDIIMMSSTSSRKSIKELKKILGENQKNIAVVAKITNAVGVKNLSDILSVADAVAICRPKLADHIAFEKLILTQKYIISQANKANIPVIVIARSLSGMLRQDIPSRSEITDISYCIFDGADCLLLTSETAIGSFPVKAVSCLANVCKEAEAAIWTKGVFNSMFDKTPAPCDNLTGIVLAAVMVSQRLVAAAFIVVTNDGKTAQLLAKYRPRCPIIAVTRYRSVAKRLHLWRGIMPMLYTHTPERERDLDCKKRINFCLKWAIEQGFVRINDPVVILHQHRNEKYTMNILYTGSDITLH